jgi:hypothetical protein
MERRGERECKEDIRKRRRRKGECERGVSN